MQNIRYKVFTVLISACLLVACNEKGSDQEANDSRFSGKKFSEHIRSTEARTPEEERSGFLLPEGFEIQLYASEPDIGKPTISPSTQKGGCGLPNLLNIPSRPLRERALTG